MKSILTVFTSLGGRVVVYLYNARTRGCRPPDQRGCLYWIGVVKVPMMLRALGVPRVTVNQPRLDGGLQ